MVELPTESEPVRIIQGDCLDIMPAIPPTWAVGAVIVDPPYGISHTTSFGSSWQDRPIANDDDTFVRDFVIGWAEARRLPWAAFGSWKQPSPRATKETLVWDKGPAFGMGDLRLPWKRSWEEIYIGGKGWSGTRDEGVVRGHLVPSWESKGRTHPHEKPVSLIRYLLSKLPPGITVLDPCMGTGTVPVACVQTGRRAIGIELDPAHFATARKRLDAALGVGSLFPVAAPAAVDLFGGE
jgi:site-specific DNA-methyltransferase (adenine-specific)